MSKYTMDFNASIMGTYNGTVELEIAGTEPTDAEMDVLYDQALALVSGCDAEDYDIDIYLGE